MMLSRGINVGMKLLKVTDPAPLSAGLNQAKMNLKDCAGLAGQEVVARIVAPAIAGTLENSGVRGAYHLLSDTLGQSGNTAMMADPTRNSNRKTINSCPVQVEEEIGTVDTTNPMGQNLRSSDLIQRLTCNDSTGVISDFTHINDLVSVKLKKNKDVEVVANSYRPDEEGVFSKAILIKELVRTLQYSGRIFDREILNDGNIESEKTFDYIAALWGAHLIQDCGMHVTMSGLEHLDPKEKYVFAPTHDSMAEFGLLFLTFLLSGHSAGFVVKKEFKDDPFFKTLLGRVMLASKRFIFVDRDDPEQSKQAIAEASAYFAKRGDPLSIIVYPQGSRAESRKDKNGHPIDGNLFIKTGGLRSGAMRMAFDTGMKYVPIVINNLGRVVPTGMNPVKTNEKVHIRIIEPVDLQTMGFDADGAVEFAMRYTEDAYRKYRPDQPSPRDLSEIERKSQFARDIKKLKSKRSYNLKPKMLERVQGQAMPLREFARLKKQIKNGEIPEVISKEIKKREPYQMRLALNQFFDRWHPVLKDINASHWVQAEQQLEDKHLQQTRFGKKAEFGDDYGWNYALNLLEWAIGDVNDNAVNGNDEFLWAGRRYKSSRSEKMSAFKETIAPSALYTPQEQDGFVSVFMSELIKSVPGMMPDLVKPFIKDKIKARLGRFGASAKIFKDKITKPKKDAQGQHSPQGFPKDSIVTPISRAQEIESLKKIASRPLWTELPEAVEQQISSMAAGDEGLLNEWREFLLSYLNWIPQIIGNFLEVYEQDKPVDRTVLDQLTSEYASQVRGMTWLSPVGKGQVEESMPTDVVLALMNLSDAKEMTSPHSEQALVEWNRLIELEKSLDQNHHQELEDGPAKTKYELNKAKIRRELRQAYLDYAKASGIATSDENFVNLHNAGLSIPPYYFSHVLSQPEFLHLEGRQDLIEAHAALFDSEDYNVSEFDHLPERDVKMIKAKSLESKDRHFQALLRIFLDKAGQARLLQVRLLRTWSSYQALAKNPDSVMWTAMQGVLAKRKIEQSDDKPVELSDSEQAYHDALLSYQKVQGPVELGRLISTAYDLLNSPQGMVYVDEGLAYLDDLLEETEVTTLRSAYQSYWKERWSWAGKERQRKDEIRPKKMDFQLWYQEGLNHNYNQESQLTMDSARAMWRQASQESKIALEDDARFKGFHTAFYNGDEHFDALLEKFQCRQERQMDHLELVCKGNLDPTKENAGHEVHYNRANEALSVLAQRAFTAASRTRSLVTGEDYVAPLNVLRAGMALKATPILDPKDQVKMARNVSTYLGKNMIPVIARAGQLLSKGHPMSAANPSIEKWAYDESFNFHTTKILDRRASDALPRQAMFQDLSHGGGWLKDFSNGTLLGSLLFIAKPGLEKIFPPSMVGGLYMLTLPLSSSSYPNQLESEIRRFMGFGSKQKSPWGDLTRLGAQAIHAFVALSMAQGTRPDLRDFLDPNHLLVSEDRSPNELRSAGRGYSVMEGMAGIMSTRNGLHMELGQSSLDATTSAKPDGQIRLERRLSFVEVTDVDPLTFGYGNGIWSPHQIRHEVHRRQLRATDRQFYMTGGALRGMMWAMRKKSKQG